MINLQSYALPDPGIAVEFLRQTMEGRERLFVQIVAASKEMRISQNAARYLYARFSLLEYMSAAYALKDRETFDAAADILVAQPLPDEVDWFRPTAAQRGDDLAVALSCRRSGRARDIARQILRGEAGGAPEDLQAHVLALLADFDYGRVAGMAARLRDAIATSDLPRHDVLLLSAWANAAEHVAMRSDAGLSAELQKIMQLRSDQIAKSLARWHKGQNVDLTAIDFWDRHTTALTVLAASVDCGTDLTSADMPFADWRWTEGVHEWA